MIAPPLRVLCVDDNDLVADALRDRLRQEHGLVWVGWVCGGPHAPDRIRALKPDIILMDLEIPGTDTFALLEHLRAREPGIRVLMFSGHVHPDDIDRALDCGTWGYLSKNDDVDGLIEAIHQVGRGEIALSREARAVQKRMVPPGAHAPR